MDIWYWTERGEFHKELIQVDRTPTMHPRVLLSKESLDEHSKSERELKLRESVRYSELNNNIPYLSDSV